MTEERENILVLIDENGEEVAFDYLDKIELDGIEYVILSPFEQDDENDIAEVIILKAIKDEYGEDNFLTIDDDNELDTVFEQFKIREEENFRLSSN